MSVELHQDPSSKPKRDAAALAEFARQYVVDPRLDAVVPGFNAPFFQAGLAGFSDSAMRLIARRQGCPYCVTEAFLDKLLLNGAEREQFERRERPDLLAQEFGFASLEENRAAGLHDHPLAGQLMGSEPDQMARAAQLLVEMGYDTVDLNFACPVKKIQKASRGGHLLREPAKAIAILKAVRQALPSETITTLKLRRAFDDSPEMENCFEQIFCAAYELGFSWVTVHARTVEQKYQGLSHWPALASLTSRYSDRLIFGSGDIWQVQDIFAMLQQTGVHAVSVARGCIGNPWIFYQARQLLEGKPALKPTLQEQRRLLLEHLHWSIKLHGEYLAVRHMRKFASKFALHHPQAAAVKSQLIKCETQIQWQDAIDVLYG